jgi:hypothetical protein
MALKTQSSCLCLLSAGTQHHIQHNLFLKEFKRVSLKWNLSRETKTLMTTSVAKGSNSSWSEGSENHVKSTIFNLFPKYKKKDPPSSKKPKWQSFGGKLK